jgi:hypothetical protein
MTPAEVAERRAAPRSRCLGACVARLPGSGEELHGMTLDLSRLGIAVALAVPLPPGFKMVVRRLGHDLSRPLHVTVVRCAPHGLAFLHGRKLSVPLSPEELADWLR